MRKSELFRRFRAVCQEVYDRNQLRWKIEAMDLMNWREVNKVTTRHDFPGEGWFQTGISDMILRCAHHRADAQDFKVCFEQIWKSRQNMMVWRAEQAAGMAA